MQYVLLIYATESRFEQPEGACLLPEIVGQHATMQGEMTAQGVAWTAARLDATARAKTISETGVHDGPFAETKEQLGGLYIVEASDEAVALAWAKKIPLLAGGRVEVRAVIPQHA